MTPNDPSYPTPLIIILGPPKSGKTTLGRRLAMDLGLPFYSRDNFKETLFDTLGWSDRAWSKRVGLASCALFWQVICSQLQARQPTMVETNFRHPLDTERFQELSTRYPFRPIQINCVADGAVLFARHQARSLSEERHPGHVDHLESVQAELVHDLLRGRYDPLEIGGEVIEVDTTDFTTVDSAAVANSVRALLQRR